MMFSMMQIMMKMLQMMMSQFRPGGGGPTPYGNPFQGQPGYGSPQPSPFNFYGGQQGFYM